MRARRAAIRPDEPEHSARTQPRVAPSLLLIGASTGGPQALTTLLSALAPRLSGIPVCVTLHMPSDLMPVVAAHVERACGLVVKVVTEPCGLRSGVVHFAPGDRHFGFQKKPLGVDIVLKTPPPAQGSCKCGVDDMFAAAARSHGARALGIVLSGMGKDGLVGARAMVAAGGTVIVQDKASSAVWGMPGAVAKANLAAAVLDPTALASEVVRRMGGGRTI